MGYGAVGINGWPLFSSNGYSSVGARILLISYILGIECLLWLRPSLMFVRYVLH